MSPDVLSTTSRQHRTLVQATETSAILEMVRREIRAYVFGGFEDNTVITILQACPDLIGPLLRDAEKNLADQVLSLLGELAVPTTPGTSQEDLQDLATDLDATASDFLADGLPPAEAGALQYAAGTVRDLAARSMPQEPLPGPGDQHRLDAFAVIAGILLVPNKIPDPDSVVDLVRTQNIIYRNLHSASRYSVDAGISTAFGRAESSLQTASREQIFGLGFLAARAELRALGSQ